MKYAVRYTARFKKDLKLARRQRRDIEKLYRVIEALANGEQLAPSYRDHSLTGQYSGTRECHISPDWLLIYEILGEMLVLVLNRLGSHADLFNQ
ncbi:MAG: type II toxin-antitoxin system YafQ family toxin [Bifidobacteriaceae bacterium]|nr:type II toxin-antitoxin system YafQ family toxin [Bifidobacteriaceae bacterium]